MRIKQSCTMFADVCARQPAPTYHPDYTCRSPVSIVTQQTKPPPCAAVCPFKLHPLDVNAPLPPHNQREVSGTPLVRITVCAGLITANCANLHRKCNARGPMDKASAYGAEDSRFDPWRACKLPNPFFSKNRW